ncbi:MAG: hypothetical protein KAV80_02705 [Methanomicrobia archaeon]|nr:hypothetical protein [Methanomicrobia archaeon]
MTKTVLQKTVSLEKKPFWKERKNYYIKEENIEKILLGPHKKSSISFAFISWELR